MGQIGEDEAGGVMDDLTRLRNAVMALTDAIATISPGEPPPIEVYLDLQNYNDRFHMERAILRSPSMLHMVDDIRDRRDPEVICRIDGVKIKVRMDKESPF